MAINIVQKPVETRGSRGSSGGSKWGQLLGAAAGAAIAGGAAAAAPATGGATLPIAAAALGGAGSGASLGGLAGGAINPATADTRQAIQRRSEGLGQAQQSGPNPQATMQQAISALRDINDPAITKEYAPVLAQGLIKSTLG